MKKCSVLVLAIFCLHNIFAQSPYLSFKDNSQPGQQILNGIITKYALQNDSTYKWYASSQNTYNPSPELVNSLVSAKGKIQFVVFGGTWCEDTQFILPKFFKLQEQAGFPDAAISMFAVDRNKKTVGGITDAFKVLNVPTIIVMKDGKELGRVVEYGKTGQWDKELTDLLK